MQLKSIWANPILIVVAVTPRNDAVRGAVVAVVADVPGAADVAGAAVVAGALLPLLLHATSVTVTRTAASARTREPPIGPPFTPQKPRVALDARQR